jgi:DNA (cytosine-5)-methyltransferase 1
LTVPPAAPDATDAVTSKWQKGTGGPSGDECQNLLVGFSYSAGSLGADAHDDCSPTIRVGSGVGISSPPAVMGVAEGGNSAWESDYAQALAGAGGKPGQGYQAARTPMGVRRLTPMECERLQGFPDGWTDVQAAPDSKRYAAMGDAVTVPVARWIGERLARFA